MIRIVYTSLLLLSLNAGAQETIQAEAEGGKPYLLHTVSNGETLSAIARNYKLTVAEITTFNKINADKGLQKDQAIRIPIKPSNLSQTECSNCRKVYYKVQPKEGLYRIGLNFGNLSTATLKKINNIQGESVDIGQNLLVGYMVAPANRASAETAIKPVEKETGKPVNEVVKNEKKPDTKPIESTVKAAPPVATEKAPPVILKPKEEPKTNVAIKAITTPSVAIAQSTTATAGTGLFSTNYEGKAGMAKSGLAAVFKSTSGWDDAKYYALMSDTEPGTVVKVSSAITGKTVYAKILGQLPQIKQNENVLLRISNAAAVALGSNSDDSLNVTVNY